MTTSTAVAEMDASLHTAASSPGKPVRERAQDITGYPAAIWLLLGGNLVVRAAGFAYPFLAYHVAARGHAAGVVGAVLATFGVGFFTRPLGGIVIGRYGDRRGRKPAMLWSMPSCSGWAGAG